MGLDTETSLHELVSLMASFLNIYKDNSALLVTIANLWWMSSGSTSKCFGHYLFDLCNRPMRQELQLILEQHGFKLHRFTKMQVFFNSKYYKTTWLVVDGIFRCWGTVNMCVCVCVCMLTQLCRTPFYPMNCSPPGSSVHEILQARILKQVAIFSLRDLPDPGIKPMCLMSPALTGEFFYQLSHQGSLKGLCWKSRKTPWRKCHLEQLIYE